MARSRMRAFWSDLQSVPTDSTDTSQTFQQRRLSLYLAFVGLIWLLTWCTYAATTIYVVDGGEVATWAHAPLTWLHLGGAVALGAGWLTLRTRGLGAGALAAVDAAATITQGVLVGVMLGQVTHALHPDAATYLLSLSQVLILRAAIIPSRPRRTALLGAAALVPVVVGAYLLHADASAEPPFLPLGTTAVTSASIAAAVTVATTTLISAALYGLATSARAALRLGQYTLVERIGEGGMGVVWRARHALLRRETAVKLLPADRAGVEAVALFEREVQRTSQLSSPNIVGIYDFGRTADGVFYYAMEYLDGIDLDRLVRRDGRLPAGRVLAILRQVATALAEAHALQLIHRDVKPANIMLCDRPRGGELAKLVDFGLVKERAGSAALTHKNAMTGTPLYMSPEAIDNPSAVDGRSDLYSLAATGYMLLTGEPVFAGDTIMMLLYHHMNTEPVPPSLRTGAPVPPKLEALLLACLAKRPADRPADAEALLLALAACDDVPPWTDADARRWWSERAPAVRAAKDPVASEPASVLTVAPRVAS